MMKTSDKFISIILYGRPNCGLCDEVEASLRLIAMEYPVSIEVKSITDDPALEEQYFLSIPVVWMDGEEVFVTTHSLPGYPELLAEVEKRLRA